MQYIRYIRSSGTKLRRPVGNVSVRHLAARGSHNHSRQLGSGCVIRKLAVHELLVRSGRDSGRQKRFCLFWRQVLETLGVETRIRILYALNQAQRARARPAIRHAITLRRSMNSMIHTIRLAPWGDSFCANASHSPRLLCRQKLRCPQKLSYTPEVIASSFFVVGCRIPSIRRVYASRTASHTTQKDDNGVGASRRPSQKDC